MSRRLVAIAGIAGAVVFAGELAGRTLVPGPDPASQAVADGCARDPTAIFQGQAPNWVFVDDKDAAGGFPPPQRFARGIVNSAYEPELAAHPTGIDDPFTHRSYDFVFNLRPAETYLIGGNPAEGTGNFEDENEQTGRLHVERESGSFPTFAWPDAGDSVVVSGSWVWDCDHFAGGEHTEIHPFHELWVVRRPSPRSPFRDVEGDLLVTDKPTVADDEAVCAHRTRGDRAAFHRCLDAGTGPAPVSAGICLRLRAPDRPSRDARLVYRAVDHGSTGRVTVIRRAHGISVCVGESPGFLAKQFFVGWRPVRRAALPVHLRVRFTQLLVRRAMDPGCQPTEPQCAARNESTRLGQVTTPPGEWNVYVDVGGVWMPWRPIVVRAFDGQRIPGRQSVDVYLPRRRPWRLFVQTRECDFGTIGPLAPCPRIEEIGNLVGDDVPGIVVARFRSPLASLGFHRSNSQLDGSTCPRTNRHGCYRLSYRISRIRDERRRALSSREKRGKAG